MLQALTKTGQDNQIANHVILIMEQATTLSLVLLNALSVQQVTIVRPPVKFLENVLLDLMHLMVAPFAGAVRMDISVLEE